MIRLFFSFLCILLGFVSVANAAPQLKSQSWILVDRLTHTTLANKNADVRTNPGNTVLLMVLYTAEKAINEKIISRTSSITVNNDALSIPPLNAARFYLEPNQSVTVSDLEKAIAVMGANDAAVALAEGIYQTIDRFVEKMNENAQKLGMKNTHYTSLIGTNDKNQYSTARDTLILANALLNDCPELSDIWTIKSLNNGVLNHNNSNSFLWRTESIRGLHRSHFQMKSWDSVIYYSRDYVEADTRFSRELLAVTLGAESDRQNTDDTMKLVNWGADNYKTLLLYPALETIDRLPVELTDDGKVRVGVKENVYVTLPRDAILQKGMKGFSATVSRLDPLVAPIKEGERIGEITVYFNKKIVAKSELVALHDVQKSNFWRRQYQRLKALVGLQ
jgi:D-alanyl-D-alanine carboxypeptidase (penicillin-binding) transmembrane protein